MNLKLMIGSAAVLATVAAAPPTATAETLRIGYQKSGAFLLLKEKGHLEEALKPLGYTVEWKEFAAGVPLLEALASGSLDIGHSGDAPVIFAQAARSPIVYVANSDASPESVGIVVPKDSPIRSVADLKGKKVAVGKGSSGHFFLVKALQNAGLQYSDIVPVFLNPPDGRAAFEGGAVDAWAVWDPFLAAAEVKGGGRRIASGKDASPFREFYLANESFAKSHSEILEILIAQLGELARDVKKDPKSVAKFLSGQLKIDYPTLEKSEIRKFRYGAHVLTPEVVAEQQGIADLFAQLELIPAPLQVSEIVWKPAATQQVKAD